MSISNETANQLLNGKFETFQEFEVFDFESVGGKQASVLYKIKKNNNKDRDDYIIETIFINN